MSASKRKKMPLIAISDDEPALLFLLASELEAEGYDVVAVEDKRELLSKLSLIKPDAIITDIKSPGMDGFEFVKAAKSDNLTKHIPIIVVTAYADKKNAIEMLKLGAADFISKPYVLDDILSSLRRFLTESSPNLLQDESRQRQVKAASPKKSIKSSKSSKPKTPVPSVAPRHPKATPSEKSVKSPKLKTPVPAIKTFLFRGTMSLSPNTKRCSSSVLNV
jgi:CheY-like chemotaxis protein